MLIETEAQAETARESDLGNAIGLGKYYSRNERMSGERVR